MSSNEYSHLNDLSQLRFLVIDEADRMIKQGSFPQLKQIFEVINQANPPPSDEDQDEESDDDDDENRLQSLKGVRGEAKVVMLDDAILAAVERERMGGGGGAKPKPIEINDDDYLAQMNEDDLSEDDSSSEEEGVHRQTFVYSATLTLPPSSHHNIKKSASTGNAMKKKGKKGNPTTVDGAIAEILEFAGARGELKILDLSNLLPDGMHQQAKKTKATLEADNVTSKKGSNQTSSVATRLPPGLSLGEVRCAQMHKDGHLYAYLVTTQQGASGPCLVFCNSIAAVRRVGETLKLLGLPVKMLHAQMAMVSSLG
jgi:ATP-dependent RNA helicase DDX24/MAK5